MHTRNLLLSFLLFSVARYRLAAGLLLFVCSAPVFAREDAPEVEVTETGGVYHIRAAFVVDAPSEYVHQVLTDFVHIYRLNPSIIESEVLADDENGSTSVRTRVLGCAGYFCQELERVETVRTLASGDIVAEVVPDKSEFRSGRTLWRIEAYGERSRVVYESEMEPDFYIPPVVGKFIAKKSIHTEITTSFNNLEKIARVRAERDWESDYRLSSLNVATYTPCGLAAR